MLCARDRKPEWSVINNTLNRPVGYTVALESAVAGAAVPPNERVVLAVQHKAAARTVTFWLNGDAVGTFPATYSTEGATLSWLGSSDTNFNYAASAVHEILGFGEVSDAELLRVMAWEAGKFGIPIFGAAAAAGAA